MLIFPVLPSGVLRGPSEELLKVLTAIDGTSTLDLDTFSTQPPDGWATESWCDIAALRVMGSCGRVLQAQETNRDGELGRTLAFQCYQLHSKCDSIISPQVQTYFAGIHGSHVQNAKLAWDAITAAATEVTSVGSGAAMKEMPHVQEQVARLELELTRTWQDTFDIMGDVAQGAQVRKFGRTYGHVANLTTAAGPVDQTLSEAHALAVRCCDAIKGSILRVFQECDSFQKNN